MSFKSKIIGVALFALPLFILPGFYDGIREAKFALVLFIASGVLSVLAWKKVHPSLGTFLFLVSVSAISSGLFHSYQLLNWAIISAAIGLSLYFVGLTKSEVRIVALGAFCGAFVNAVYAFLQTQGIEYIFLRVNQSALTPVGFLGQQTILGPWLVVGVIAALYLKKYWALPLFLWVIYLCDSSFTFASLGAAIIVWSFSQWSLRVFAIVSMAIIVLGVFAYKFKPDFSNAQGRGELWSNVVYQASKAPILGRGIGTYPIYAEVLQSEDSKKMNGVFRQAHSDFIQLYFEMGLLGLLTALWALCAFFIRFIRYRFVPEIAFFSSIVFVFLVNSLGSFPMRLAPHGVLALCALVAVVSFRKEVNHD